MHNKPRSADLWSAVSPTSSRQGAHSILADDCSNDPTADRGPLCCCVTILFLLLFLFRASAAESLILTGAVVHTVSGPILAPGQVLLRDGKIAEVGTNLAAADARTLDLTGQHLYPAMLALGTTVGLIEIADVRATADTTEVGDYTPDVQSWIAVNPDSELVPVARANGIGFFEPVPLGGVVSGQSGLIGVQGWTTEQMTIKKPIALHVFWPAMDLQTNPGRRGGKNRKSLEEQAKGRQLKVQALKDFFDEAAAYAKAKEAGAKGGTPLQQVPAWEAMLPYVRGELPIVVHADDVRQIRAMLDWAATRPYRIILSGGREAWKLASELAAKKIPVVYTHVYTRPMHDSEGYDVQFCAPQVLHQAGVQVTFSIGEKPFDAPSARNLPYDAAQAVAFGLPADEALRGLTLYPAQLAGVAKRLGSIEPGKDATLFSADGDILDIRVNVKHMWISGKEISLETRQTRLYEKYKNRPRPQ